MSAQDHLNEVQFASPHELADKYWDPGLKNPETLRRWSGPGYIAGLAKDISQRGMQNPIQITGEQQSHVNRAGRPYVWDGHHRLIAAMDLGLKKVPYKWVSGKPGEQ